MLDDILLLLLSWDGGRRREGEVGSRPGFWCAMIGGCVWGLRGGPTMLTLSLPIPGARL